MRRLAMVGASSASAVPLRTTPISAVKMTPRRDMVLSCTMQRAADEPLRTIQDGNDDSRGPIDCGNRPHRLHKCHGNCWIIRAARDASLRQTVPVTFL